MVENLHSIKYVSRSLVSGDLGELDRLRKQCHSANAEHGVTGALYYGDQVFFQVLEGPAQKLEQLHANLLRDLRHTDFKLLSQTEITHRFFSKWDMKFVNGDLNPTMFAAFTYDSLSAATPAEINQHEIELRLA